MRTGGRPPRDFLKPIQWGTPTSRDWKDTGDMTNVPVNGLLDRQVKQWGTPRAADGMQHSLREPKNIKNGNARARLEDQVALSEGQGGGSLNPTWVEWLMGFPTGWTDLEASGTPLSRRSRSGSDAGS
jgi:hypothetical protein